MSSSAGWSQEMDKKRLAMRRDPEGYLERLHTHPRPARSDPEPPEERNARSVGGNQAPHLPRT